MDSVELERGTTVGSKEDANANNKIVATQHQMRLLESLM